MTSSNAGFGLYLHVPFCAAKCPYCDFYSGRELSLLPVYENALVGELITLERTAPFVNQSVFARPLSSVYFGGGTPGLLPPAALTRIMETVRAHYALLPGAEVTVEVNPTLKEKRAWFEGAYAAGVNRVSVGLQTALPRELRALGRRGSPEEVLKTVAAARAAGIGNVSLDLMLGIPGQTQESLQTSLTFALSLQPAHISVYILKLEPGTPMYARRERLADLPDDDAAAELYLFTCRYLKERGMRHYEISNFCFGNEVGRHNLNYWRCGEYLGLGPAAHSFMNGQRLYFQRDLGAFLGGASPVSDGPGGDAQEVFMLALRLDEGLMLPAFGERFGLRFSNGFYGLLSLYEEKGLLIYKNGRLTLTENGFLLSNSVLSALLAEM